MQKKIEMKNLFEANTISALKTFGCKTTGKRSFDYSSFEFSISHWRNKFEIHKKLFETSKDASNGDG